MIEFELEKVVEDLFVDYFGRISIFEFKKNLLKEIV